MIFISHQHKDKDFVSEIAFNLEKVYGEDKVFYDDWSIKPGDNIIGRMSEGIRDCRFFFFFITENSLNSEMVTLEWTSALKERGNRDIKFIPVRAEDVSPPTIISSLSYLDLYSQGIETTIHQMVEIINGEKKEREYPTFNNLQAFVLEASPKEIHFYITVKRFFEPNGKFFIATDLNKNQASLSREGGIFGSNFLPNILSENGKNINAFSIDTMEGVKKGFLTKLVFRVNLPGHHIVHLYHLKTSTSGVPVPVKIINDPEEIPMLL